MRARTFFLIFIAIVSVTVAVPDAANAQSPQGLLNGITRPFRSILNHLGHFPRLRHHNEAEVESSPNDAGARSGAGLGQVGPPTWPTAYEDMLGYALWPDEYVQKLRGHGFDVIADTITGRFEAPHALAKVSTNGAAVLDGGQAASTACSDAGATQASWPAGRVSQTIQLQDAQLATVDRIQKAVAQGSQTITVNCADGNATSAPDRLYALVKTLWNVHDAGAALRVPLEDFDRTLTNAQKVSFASRMPQETSKLAAKKQYGAVNLQYQACAAPNVPEAERLIKQIEIRVHPISDQAANLENLRKVSSDMAKLLMAFCARPIPKTPLARLDAAIDQLAAMTYAATTLQIAFNNFYSNLDAVQKARFD